MITSAFTKLGKFFSESSKCLFIFGLLALVVFKFWLVNTEEIYGFTTEFDSLWFLNSAKHWYWNAAYSWIAFCRPPAYPIFIAIAHVFEIPLRGAIEFLQIGGYIALIGALRLMRLPRWLALVIFALLLFHPESFQRNNYVQADTFYAAILIYVVAGICFTLITHRVIPAIATGIAFAILWNTREESVLLFPIFLIYAALAFYSYFKETRAWGQSAKKIFAPVSAMFVSAALLILAVDIANYRTFATFEKSDTTGPDLRAAYRALLRIKPKHPVRFASISREAREIAYTVSPTFAQLKPYFESDLGHKWEGHGTPGEIGTGWFIWALRQMADRAGAYKNPQAAANFYHEIAKEINLACDQKRIPSRFVFTPVVDPNVMDSISYIPKSFCGICHLFFLRYKMSSDREDAVLGSRRRALYDEMAGRIAARTRLGTLQIAGWAFRLEDPILLVAHDAGRGEIDSATSSFGERADVVKKFGSEGEVPLKSEFRLSLVVRRKGDPAGWLIFITQSGRKFMDSTKSILTGQAVTENSEQLHCQVLTQEFTPATGSLSQSFENFIGNYYHYLMRGLIWTGVIAVLILIINFRTLRLSDPVNALLVLVSSIIAVRVDFFAFIDATAFPGIDSRFLFPVISLYTLLQIVLIYQAARIMSSKFTLKLNEQLISSGVD